MIQNLETFHYNITTVTENTEDKETLKILVENVVGFGSRGRIDDKQEMTEYEPGNGIWSVTDGVSEQGTAEIFVTKHR